MMMTSHNSEKIPGRFVTSPLSGCFSGNGNAVIVIAALDVFPGEKLSLEERKKSAAMSSPEARHRFLAGRRLVRGVIREWFGTDAADAPVCEDDAGKPFLQWEGMPCFSISHSGKLVAAVFCKNAAGIDLELERDIDAPALASRFFSPREASLVEREGDKSLFFRLWVCREAAIKGNGRGMASLLAGTEVVAPGEESPLTVRTGDESWQTFPFTLSHGYQGAVAFRDPPEVILWCDLR